MASSVKKPELGTTEYTNYLLGGEYFDPKTGKQLQTFTPTPVKKPVSILSTDNAIKNLEKGLNTLNQISPTTSPGYVPPAPTQNVDRTASKVPKAYFTNEAGQEAEFDEKQLKDRATQKFLIDNGYVQTRTEGPSFDPAKRLKSDVRDVNADYENLVNDFMSYDLDKDPAFQGIAGNIVRQYSALRQEVENANKQRAGSLQTLGFRTGTTQYAGAIQSGIQGEELRQANGRIAQVIAAEQAAISAAREAYRTGKYADFQKKITALEKLRTQKTDELTTYNKRLEEINTQVRESTIQSSRDSAIANLLSQGVTDPKQILNFLNYDEQGNNIGDFTAEEIQKTMKALATDSAGGDIEKLSGNIRDFFILKENGTLPGSIGSLPEEQQLGAWMNFMKPPKATGAGGGSGRAINKITVAEAKSNGLPLSVVGMSEEEILGSMYDDTPPQWFTDKLSEELQMSLSPTSSKLTEAWEKYRQAFIDNFGGQKTSEATDYSDRAAQYFKDTFEGVSDEDAQALAEQVQINVNGGMSYAKAVEKVVADNQ